MNTKPISGLCCDSSYSHKTKILEYRVVDIETLNVLYQNQIHDTYFANNIGEFFALVRAVKHCIDNKTQCEIYSDSNTAISWVQNGIVKSSVLEEPENKKLLPFINAGLAYIKTINSLPTILKWNTKDWGEIPADFGRKQKATNNPNVKNLIETLNLKQDE